jgi:hypothetical protein
MVCAHDLAGAPRVVGNVPDMGALEFIPEPCAGLAGVILAALWRRRMD